VGDKVSASQRIVHVGSVPHVDDDDDSKFWAMKISPENRRCDTDLGRGGVRHRQLQQRLRDVSYTSFHVQKDDSYAGRGRVAALAVTTVLRP